LLPVVCIAVIGVELGTHEVFLEKIKTDSYPRAEKYGVFPENIPKVPGIVEAAIHWEVEGKASHLLTACILDDGMDWPSFWPRGQIRVVCPFPLIVGLIIFGGTRTLENGNCPKEI